MNYVSTFDQSPPVPFQEAVFSGLAPDGGLYVPEKFPALSQSSMHALLNQSLQGIGAHICSLFADDVPEDAMREIVADSLNFPIPLVHLDENFYLLELFHGPTLAFKDIGARFLARILSYYLRTRKQHLTILVATSGDTGSAVAHGFFGVDGIEVFVLYPSGKISKLQELQMTTLGENIHAVEVRGTFDDCQRMVKESLSDHSLSKERGLTTANSMNLGRLIPQIVYYVWGIAQWRANFSGGEPPVVVVPSGNFGNLTAAVYARHMGIPIRNFLAATNVNDTVPVYLETGEYRPMASRATISNAMDVGNPSNVARLQHLFHHSVEQFRRLIAAIRISDEETVQEIRNTHERTGIILDPHTAVGVAAARRHGSADPVIVAATAHAAKFFDVIERRTGLKIRLPQQLEDVFRRRKESSVIGADTGELKAMLGN